MKIATQNLLLIVPIFLLLAAATVVLLFFSERREVRWGLESQAQGLALSIAEFTDAAAVAAVTDTNGEADAPALRAPLERLLKLGQAHRVEMFDLASGAVRRVIDVGARVGTPTPVDERLLLQAARGELVTRDVEDAGVLKAYAPIRDEQGVMRALVAVETSTAPLVEHQASVVRRASMALLALFVVGCLVSLGLTKLITGEIERLTRAARAFASGHYDVRLAPGPIEEVAVVGTTFGIMGSVLEDATLRSTREMLQFERFNTEASLSAHYAARFSAPAAGDSAGVRFAIDRLGPAVHGDFWFHHSEQGRHWACLGRVSLPASFDAVLTASAAGALLHEGVARGADMPALLAEAGALFPIHCCLVLQWGDGDNRIAVYRLSDGAPVSQDWLEPQPGRTIAFTTLDEASDRKAARYANAYAFETPRSCVEELRRLFGDGTPGGVLVLQVTST